MLRKLSNREIEVIVLVSCGMSNKEIAGHLGLADRTIKSYLNRIFIKLSIPSDKNPYRSRLHLARNWNCELYQEGLKELGYL